MSTKPWAEMSRAERIRSLLWSNWPPSPYEWHESFTEASPRGGRQPQRRPEKIVNGGCHDTM